MAGQPGDAATVPASAASCPACGAQVCEFDQYCARCGEVLARLRWRVPEEERWRSDDGHVAVRAGAPAVRLVFSNEGVVPLALVLLAEDVARLPEWVDRPALAEALLLVPPGGADRELEIPLVTARLMPLFEPQGPSAAGDDARREAPLPFLTNLNELRDGVCAPRPLKVTLLAGRLPWVSPASSFYPFLPLERLAAAGFEHPIELHNESIEALDLRGRRIRDDPGPPPEGGPRLLAEQLMHGAPFDEQRIDSGATWTDHLRLAIPASPQAMPAWFSVVVEYLAQNADGGEQPPLSSRLQGWVGFGPRLAVQGPASLWVLPEQIQAEHGFQVKNPGQIPVQVEAVEVWWRREEDEEPAPARDWLSLTGIAAGDVLAPQEVRTLTLRFNPALRPEEETDDEDSQRRIRLLHDGLPSPSEPRLDLEVSVRFGRAKEIMAGIDFGTSNSVVCIGDLQGTFDLRLEPRMGDGPNRIRSLMYCSASAAQEGSGEQFLFGEAAFSSAAIRPENLVRSIKTLVARDPDKPYVFFHKRAAEPDEQQHMTLTAQQLLNLFIAKLRQLGEEAVPYLPPQAYRALRLDVGTQVRLSRAVFTHPVETSPQARQALMAAAHGAGINLHIDDVEEFFAQSCIDEATAAVLAYVARRVDQPPILDVPPTDRERVLCFDMGGGSTDLAAVEVLGMQALLADRTGEARVVVNLESKDGTHFGGDDLDEILAALILEEVERQSLERGAPLILDDLRRALLSRSYTDFRMDLQGRRAAPGTIAASGGYRAEDEALTIFKLATEVLTKAEEVKRQLSASAAAPPVILAGSGWPRQTAGSQEAAANFEVPIERAGFEVRVREEMRSRAQLQDLLDGVVRGAGWEWPSVTTLLFTGQSARVPVIRQDAVQHVEQRRGPDAGRLLLVEPGQAQFDPKNCVAIGAAIWGANRNAGSWLQINNRVNERLTFDLATKYGPNFRPVPGLQRGQSLPATGSLRFEKGLNLLELHRNRSPNPYVSFRLPRDRRAEDLTIRVLAAGRFIVAFEDKEIRGKVES